jgi:Domain of unknown function (DUF4340)
MKLRTLAVSVALLAIIAAIVFFVRRPGPPAAIDPRTDGPLIETALLEKAAQFRLGDGGKNVTLVRKPDGTWIDQDYYALPADFSKISGFAGSLHEAKIDRLVTASPERMARLEFKDTHIVLLDDAGKEIWTLTLGKYSDTGDRYVRYGVEPKAYLVKPGLSLDLEAKNWVDTQLLSLKPDDVAGVEIDFPGDSPLKLTRAKNDAAWTPASPVNGQRVKADKIVALLGSLSTIRFLDTNDASDPSVAVAKANLRTITLTTFDGKTIAVAMGRKPAEKKPKAPAAENKPAQPSGTPVANEGKPGAATETAPEAAKPSAPEFETIPAGPVYVFIKNSDTNAAINEIMQKRAYQISEYTFTGLPQKPAELFEAIPPLPETKPVAPTKS